MVSLDHDDMRILMLRYVRHGDMLIFCDLLFMMILYRIRVDGSFCMV